MTELIVTYNSEYRATLGICSIVEARRYHEHGRRVSAWFETKTGHRLEESVGDVWRQLPEDVRANTDMALSMGEIIASLRKFEAGVVGVPVDESTPTVTWTPAEFPAEWRNPETFAHSMPAQLFDDLLTASRRLNGGLFITSPFFGLRSNIVIK